MKRVCPLSLSLSREQWELGVWKQEGRERWLKPKLHHKVLFAVEAAKKAVLDLFIQTSFTNQDGNIFKDFFSTFTFIY